jgi:hypothetical protein
MNDSLNFNYLSEINREGKTSAVRDPRTAHEYLKRKFGDVFPVIDTCVITVAGKGGANGNGNKGT